MSARPLPRPTRALGVFSCPARTMLGLSTMPLQRDALIVSCSNTVLTTHSVIAAASGRRHESPFHQTFQLDDRHDVLFLTQRRIARERIGVGDDAVVARDASADVDDRAPLSERRAEIAIFDQPLGRPSRPSVMVSPYRRPAGLRPCRPFDAGSEPAFARCQLHQRRARSMPASCRMELSL